ncbi:MAG: response regulator transcription factor [Vulcanimicrobiaceae bacterium]
MIEDDHLLAEAIRTMLEAEKFAIDVVGDGDTALEYFLRQTYDCAILDVVLPGRDGFSIAQSVRAESVDTPILMLTARGDVEDRVRGLDSGADDYLVKPFVPAELLARLHALLRRSDRPIQRVITAGKLHIDVDRHDIRYDGKTLKLGVTEFRLLEFFARNAGLTFSREQLLERLWHYNFEGSSNIVDVYVSRLRRRLKGVGGSKLIKTVWGVGYRVDP